jgi:hypothetical protein
MGTKNRPRINRLENQTTEFSLEDLMSHIRDDVPDLMKQAAAAAKGGNAQVLTALISLMTRYADAQSSDKATEVMKMVMDIRKSALDKVKGA